MSEQRIIIVSADSYEREYAEILFDRVKTGHSGYQVFLWSEKEYSSPGAETGGNDKIILFGKARRIDKRAGDDVIRVKLDKFGMKYGWAGDICAVFVADDISEWSKQYNSFKSYCLKMDEKYGDVPIPRKNVVAEKLAGITGNDGAGHHSQYAALLHEFLDGGGLVSFMARANPGSAAFTFIVEQLPGVDEYPVSANSAIWDTIERRDGYEFQCADAATNRIFRILDRNGKTIAWGKREYERLGLMAFLALFEEEAIRIVDVPAPGAGPAMIYGSIEALKPIQELLSDADAALGNTERTLKDSTLADVLLMTNSAVASTFIKSAVGIGMSYAMIVVGGKMLGVAGAAAITKALAIAGGIIGGGLFAGLFVLALPVAALAAGGVVAIGKIKRRALIAAKQRLLQIAVEKQDAILGELRLEAGVAKQRSDYLVSLDEALRRAIDDLKQDLG